MQYGADHILPLRAKDRRASLGKIIKEIGLQQTLNKRAWIRLQGFADFIDEMRIKADQLDALTLTRQLISQLDYADWLREACSSQKQADSAIENIEELISWIGNLQKQLEDPSLDRLVSHLSLMSILQNDEDKNEQNAVQLMTLHAAKGLEFPHVYIVGFEEDCLPHRQSQDAAGIEEERRLAYVGITRAEKTLTLSHAKTRQKFGETQHCEPSRYLFELPEADLEGAEHTASKLSEGEKKQQGLKSFCGFTGNAGSCGLKEAPGMTIFTVSLSTTCFVKVLPNPTVTVPKQPRVFVVGMHCLIPR